VSNLLHDLHLVFRKHGPPSASEDPHWAAVLHMQVLHMATLEIIMESLSSIQGKVSDLATEVDKLDGDVSAFVASRPTAPVGLSAEDQALVDGIGSSVDNVTARLEKIRQSLTKTADVPSSPSTDVPPPPVDVPPAS
jgi:hypothetical protein